MIHLCRRRLKISAYLVMLELRFQQYGHIIGQLVRFGCVSHRACLSVSQTEVNRQHASVTSKTRCAFTMRVVTYGAQKFALRVRQVGGKV